MPEINAIGPDSDRHWHSYIYLRWIVHSLKGVCRTPGVWRQWRRYGTLTFRSQEAAESIDHGANGRPYIGYRRQRGAQVVQRLPECLQVGKARNRQRYRIPDA